MHGTPTTAIEPPAKQWRPAGAAAILVGGVLLSLTMGLSGCGLATIAPKTSRIVDVVAAENFWGSIASQLGGSHARVTSIITSPNTDPHLYSSSAVNAAEVAAARIVIVNGAGYDDFMGRLLGGTSSRYRSVLTISNLLESSGTSTGADPNPHFWYDIPKITAVARAVEEALVTADPKDAARLAGRLRSFDRSLRPILRLVSTIRARYAGTPVAYTERVPEYLLSACGLRVVTPPQFASAIEAGNEPSPAAILSMNEVIVGHKARVLLYNTQTVSPVTEHARQLALDAGIPVVGVSET
ncbi:MAG: metal ABC transporter solute-binding protein, Zn/Mn family, partial [Acidimicrobiales bacterium]